MGGIGILVMAVAVLPLLGVGGSQIFRAESSGPMKEGRLTPRIADTAKAFYNIYLAISVACASAITLQEWTGTTPLCTPLPRCLWAATPATMPALPIGREEPWTGSVWFSY